MLPLLVLTSLVSSFVWIYLVLVVLKMSLCTHLVWILLTLEFMSLMSVWALSGSLSSASLGSVFMIALFTSVVCEACVGLGVLIHVVRNSGNDKVANIN